MKLQKAADLDTQYHVQYICPLNSVSVSRNYSTKFVRLRLHLPITCSMTQVIDELTGNKENTMCCIVR